MGRRRRRGRNISRLQRCFELFCCAICMRDVFCRDEYNDDDVYENSASVSSATYTPASSRSDTFSVATPDSSEADDVIVTRVYASASAENIVKQHKQFYPRSESAMKVESYVAKKLETEPKMRSYRVVDWQTPSTSKVIKEARTIDIVNAIGIQRCAEYDMFADTDLLSDTDDDMEEEIFVDEAGDTEIVSKFSTPIHSLAKTTADLSNGRGMQEKFQSNHTEVRTKERIHSQKMTVEKIKRSQSMWNMSTGKRYSVTNPAAPVRSASVVSASNWDLSESSQNTKSLISRFKKRSRDRRVQTTRYSSGPCLCGDVDAVDSNGRSLLFYSARYGQLDTVVQLIEAGCSPNQQDVLGNTPLHEAIEKSHLEIAEAFLRDGMADVNLSGFNGETPLMAAVTRGQLDAVKLLVRYGAKINECDDVENPPIYRALQRGWNEISEFLLDQKCDVNKTTANGMTCFFAAAHCNKINVGDIARRLLKTDYDFKKDAEWLATEGCPISAKEDSKHHNKIMVRAGLQNPKKGSFLSNGKRKIVKTFRGISKDSR